MCVVQDLWRRGECVARPANDSTATAIRQRNKSPLGEVVGQDVAAGGPALLHPLGLQSGDPTIIEPSLVPSRSQGPPEAPFGSVVGSLGIL